MGIFTRKEEKDDEFLALKETIAMLKLIALDLQETADIMEEKVEAIRAEEGE